MLFEREKWRKDKERGKDLAMNEASAKDSLKRSPSLIVSIKLYYKLSFCCGCLNQMNQNEVKKKLKKEEVQEMYGSSL